MAYVDLNPIRSQLAHTPEDSDFTSIQKRIENIKNSTSSFLARFTGNETNQITSGVPYHLLDYIELVEWTGRAIRGDKRGSINGSGPPILTRLGLDPSDWTAFATGIEEQFGNWIGSPEQFSTASMNIGQRWICTSAGSRSLY